MTVRNHDDDVSKPTLSLREYARARGQNVSVVKAALDSGRLEGAVIQDVGGGWRIISVEAANAAWEKNTKVLAGGHARPERDISQPEKSRPSPPSQPSLPPPVDPNAVDLSGETPSYMVSRAVREAALARKERAAAEIAELELAQVRGVMVDATEMRQSVIAAYTKVKTHLLGVPTKFRQRCPHVATQDVREMAALIREALDELAAGDADSIGSPQANVDNGADS